MGAGGRRIADLLESGLRVGWLSLGEEAGQGSGLLKFVMPTNPAEYAASLYAVLHELDALGLDRLVVTRPPEGEEWLAVRATVCAGRPPTKNCDGRPGRGRAARQA